MTDMQKFFLFLAMLVLVAFLFLPRAHGLTENCRKAVSTYNHASETNNLGEKERLLIHALSLGCADKKIVAKIHNNLADAYEKQDRLSLALTYYRKALETKPDLATSYFSVGDIFFRLKGYYSAALMYGKGLRHRPEDEESRKNKEEAELRARRCMVIYFDFDSSMIPDRYLKRLDLVAEAIKENGLNNLEEILVIGHTCDLGLREYNRRLSLRRAQEVVRYLKKRLPEISGGVKLIGKGEDIPVLDGTDRNAHVLNRRVEIIVSVKEREPLCVNEGETPVLSR